MKQNAVKWTFQKNGIPLCMDVWYTWGVSKNIKIEALFTKTEVINE